MKKILFTALLLLSMGVSRATGIMELSNLNTPSGVTVNFEKEIIDGKITWNVFYEIRESEYTDVDAYLTKIGQILKDQHDCKISVKSYADKGTGNAKLNIMYSRLRNEKAVAALVAAGVDKKLITAEYFGDTVQPFAENDKNRVTIISVTGLKEITPIAPNAKDLNPTAETKPISVTTPTEQQSATNTTAANTATTNTTAATDTADSSPTDATQAEKAAKSKEWATFFTPNRNADIVSHKGHWFVGANVGAQMYIGDHNRQTKFKDVFTTLITPSADVYVGYWFNRFLAARVDVGGFNIKGLCYNYDSQIYTGKDSPFAHPTETYECRTGETLNKQRFNYVNTHFDLLLNLMQVTKNGNDFFDLIPYAGFGWSYAWSPYNHSHNTNARAWDFGIILAWHFGPHWAINLDARGQLIPDSFDGDGHYNGNNGKNRNNKYEGIPSINLGLSYTF